MATTVTLLFFSGRRDPTWELAAGDAATLATLLENHPSATERSSLGYRGFLVQSGDPELPPRTVVRGLREVEEFLLRSGAAHLSESVLSAVRAAIERG